MKTFVTTLHSGVRPTLSRAISSMLVPPVYYSLRLVCNMITIIVLLVLLIRQTVASSLLSVDTEHGVERSLVYSSAFDEMLLLVDQDGSVRRLALTESDARYLGVTVEAGTKSTSSHTAHSNIELVQCGDKNVEDMSVLDKSSV